MLSQPLRTQTASQLKDCPYRPINNNENLSGPPKTLQQCFIKQLHDQQSVDLHFIPITTSLKLCLESTCGIESVPLRKILIKRKQELQLETVNNGAYHVTTMYRKNVSFMQQLRICTSTQNRCTLLHAHIPVGSFRTFSTMFNLSQVQTL